MTNVDIRALAKLARLEVADEEIAKLEKEVPAILDFVETIQKVEISAGHPSYELRNVMREDKNPHESGAFTKELLDAAPSVKAQRIVVKQVLSRKKK